jgi:hypothetical protein
MARKGDDMANTSGRSPPSSRASRSSIASLEHSVEALQRTVMLIAEANAVPNILTNSFEEISARLEPLRNLAPQFKLLSEESGVILTNLHRDHKRPDWGPLGGTRAPAPRRFGAN